MGSKRLCRQRHLAIITGVDLSGADLSEANINEADLSGTSIDGATDFSGAFANPPCFPHSICSTLPTSPP